MSAQANPVVPEKPEVETPEVETPEVETPEVKTPEAETTKVETKKVEIPDSQQPANPNRTRNIVLIAFRVLAGIVLIFLAIWAARQAFAPVTPEPLKTQIAPLATPETKPSWVESWTVSPVSTDNFVVEYGDWKVTTNDLYTFGDRTVDVTIVVNNTSNKIVVINYAGMNWDRGIQVKPGERITFTGKAGDFRVTLLDYKNQ